VISIESKCEFFSNLWDEYERGTLPFVVNLFRGVPKGSVPSAYLEAAAAHKGLLVLTPKGEQKWGQLWETFFRAEFSEIPPAFESWDEFLLWASERKPQTI
jgi:hypothetical protein